MILLASLAFAEPPPATSAFPDLGAKSRRLSCIAPPGSTKPHPGAESFFSGAFRLTGNQVTGEERRYMWANATWEAQPRLRQGHDCKDVWTLTGTKTRVGDRCPECSFAIAVSAVVDTVQSTCVRRVTSDDNRFKATYDVLENSDGSFEVRFQSGKVIGKGKMDGDVFSWMSEQTCMWF